MVIAVWVLAVLGVILRVLIQPLNEHSVYDVYTKAARNWLAGNSLYQWQDPGGYRYAPGVAILFVPLSILPDRLGGDLWRILDVAVFIFGLASCWMLRIPTRGARRYWAIVLLLTLPLSLGSINSGQANCLLIGLLLWTTAASFTQRWNVAAITLSIACFLKLYPAALAMLICLLFPRKLIPRFMLACGVALMLPFLFQKPSSAIQQYAEWILRLGAENRQDRPAIVWFHDVRLLLRTLHITLSTPLFITIQAMTGVLIALICRAGQQKQWPMALLLGRTLALACCWMTLFGPSTEVCTYMLIAPSLAWALTDAWFDPQALAQRIALILSYACFVGG